jgi:hypothetical protein
MTDAARRSQTPGTLAPALAADLAAELLRRADDDQRLTRAAQSAANVLSLRRVDACHRENAEALKAIVDRHGWPTARAVGERASTAALMILLHAPELALQLRCRDLIVRAADDGACPAVHHAFIADHCAVELGQPQFYGTRINPDTLLPYEIRRPQTLDERRHDVGLGTLDAQMRALGGARRP